MKNLIKTGMVLWLCLLIVRNGEAQNLVNNPSFEIFVEADQNTPIPPTSDYIHLEYLPTSWSGYASCDFMIESPNDPPNRARTGNNFIRLVTYASNGNVYREFATSTTTTALEAGELYEVEYWVRNDVTNSSNAQGVGLTQYPMGVYFSTAPVPCDYPDDCIFNYTPVFEEYITPSVGGWNRINGYFIPDQDAVYYITVGNFIDSGNSGFDGIVNILTFVDDVSITTCTDPLGLSPQPAIDLPSFACIYTQLTADISSSVDVQAYRYQLCDENSNPLTAYSAWIEATPTEIDVSALATGNLEKGNC